MYGTSLREHITTDFLKSALENGQLSESIAELVKDNPMPAAPSYIVSTNIADIIKGSDYVLKITVKGERNIVTDPVNRTTHICTVEAVYKGELSKKEIMIVFPLNAVKENGEYIVSLFELKGTGKEYFLMSSKNSVYSTEKLEEIIEMIE